MDVPYPKAMAMFPTIRQSLAQSFDNCALGTRFEFGMRQGWHFSYQARGEMFHRFASKALVTMAQYDEEEIPVDAALTILHEVLRQEDVDRECPRCGSPKIRKGITKKGMRYCLSCKGQFQSRLIRVPMASVYELYWVVKKWAKDNSFSIRNLVDVEKRLETTIQYPNPNGGSVSRTLTGQFDALFVEGDDDEHAVVLDWKDMWRLPPEADLGFGGYFQQRFYAFLIFSQPMFRSIETVTLREFYVRYSAPRPATLTREHDFENIREEMAALIELFDRSVELNEWFPSPGQHCGYCVAPQKCTIFPEARGEGRITNEEESRVVAAQFIVAQAIVKQQREQLKGWCNQHGPIPVKDAKGKRMIGFQAFEEEKAATVDQIAAEEARVGHALTAGEIAALTKSRPRTRLTTYVPKVEEIRDEDAELIRRLQQAVREAEVEHGIAVA